VTGTRRQRKQQWFCQLLHEVCVENVQELTLIRSLRRW
jgi:hypothetical protein